MNNTPTRTRPRRRIAAEIERLDPATGYEAIWRLTSSYGLNDFALNFVYAHLFPHFYLPPHGSQPLWDGGDGKVIERALQRVEDTIRNNLMWWFHGPSHPKTRQSVAGVNKLHAYHARRHPGVFAHQNHYFFTLAFSAASLHRFNLKVTQAILDQFAYRWFPAPLRGLGRAMAASTLHPNYWKTHKVAVSGSLARRILLRATGLMIRLGQLAAPDPDRTYYEELTAATRDQRASRNRRIREFDEEFSRTFRTRHHLPPRRQRAAGSPRTRSPRKPPSPSPDQAR